jgi:hypothetical protein
MGRLIGWSIVALIVLMPITLMIPEVRALPFKPFNDRPQLDSELRTAIALVDATAAEVEQGRTVTLMTQNIAQRRSDQVDLSERIGYDHCDDWKSWFFPGWSSWKQYEVEVADARDAEALLGEVRAYWESLGYRVERFENQIFIDLDHTGYWLTVPPPNITPPPIDFAVLTGGTDCLLDD